MLKSFGEDFQGPREHHLWLMFAVAHYRSFSSPVHTAFTWTHTFNMLLRH